ncbi:hypothetical protein EN904_14225 [Mesorhizobium sp. M7A.F.Ca.CA.001.07.2.1]|nr:hypothetical protein EJ079_01445 [Mesorhizobium sp. M7A.F.Ce.TU.012.03.2.1]RUU92577.1 hypothetical protein EOB59_06730 [Mesorhizobium sp. M7A.F.Ca.MR.176.00.0.0]RUX80985.1 hypothetical protein EN983_06200 [Mesorhizobium sp. M7A.F.Ca.CA.004.08.2.1]RUX88407.1 hypothetical protein EN982_06875 [Mesorhizobium sp. M7A.F.Ca.CA.004.08.1.1]RUY07735.1 hypothetical protein EN985_02365 [Mesorhizobium sp. M7A.F.Ca.CA.004.04.1.1]RUY19646.1 hypothetical protein EN984_26555 [Mesorhizobium sp. M7A.F.Ca.CA.0
MMQRTVTVIEKTTGRVIGALPIDLAQQNHEASDDQYFTKAFEAAMDSGLISEADKHAVEFRLE